MVRLGGGGKKRLFRPSVKLDPSQVRFYRGPLPSSANPGGTRVKPPVASDPTRVLTRGNKVGKRRSQYRPPYPR